MTLYGTCIQRLQKLLSYCKEKETRRAIVNIRKTCQNVLKGMNKIDSDKKGQIHHHLKITKPPPNKPAYYFCI